MSDAQAAYEKTLTGIPPALAGASLIYGAGMLESGMTCDLGQLVMDNETISLIRHLVRGVPVNDETLAVDVIDEVGPRGEFISSEHTLRHMREATMPKLYHRDVRDAWLAEGATDMATRAREEAKRIVAEHRVEPLPGEVQAEIERIKRSADAAVGAGPS